MTWKNAAAYVLKETEKKSNGQCVWWGGVGGCFWWGGLWVCFWVGGVLGVVLGGGVGVGWCWGWVPISTRSQRERKIAKNRGM